MDYKEYERHIRHIMCIFLALEALLICVFAVIFNFSVLIGTWNALYCHIRTPMDGLLLPLLSIIPVGFTVLSIYRKWIYRLYELLHCLLGISALSWSGAGFIICLIFTVRFFVYLFLIKGVTRD